jgi:hypothetical protein
MMVPASFTRQQRVENACIPTLPLRAETSSDKNSGLCAAVFFVVVCITQFLIKLSVYCLDQNIGIKATKNIQGGSWLSHGFKTKRD